MRWTPGGDSSNIEDQRGSGGGLPIGRLGLGGTIVLLILSVVFHRNLFQLFGGNGSTAPAASGDDKELVQFVTFVLDDTQTSWKKILPEQTHTTYEDAKLVLFTDSVQSGCGNAQSSMGPFYCPTDRKVYIDLGFYRALKEKLGAPGDFAQAYVIAHEIGHHVQNQLGSEGMSRRRGASKQETNDLSVRTELQADCYAGVWAFSTQERKLLEAGDVEEAMNAAAAVGDDRLQHAAGDSVSPETWTHGSSAMRMRWFKRGMANGRIADCDTFGASSL